MEFTTTRKVIKIGTSLGATLPAGLLKELDIEAGDYVEITVKRVIKRSKAKEEYEEFKDKYGDTLEGLAGR